MILGIRNFRLNTIIGDLPSERKKPQPLIITLSVEINPKKITDDLRDTVDYSAFPQIIKNEAKKKPQLLEKLAIDILTATLAADKRIHAADIEIQKPKAIKNADGSFIHLRKEKKKSS